MRTRGCQQPHPSDVPLRRGRQAPGALGQCGCRCGGAPTCGEARSSIELSGNFLRRSTRRERQMLRLSDRVVYELSDACVYLPTVVDYGVKERLEQWMRI